ncbi:cbb3-type cytochrome c oxidase subunit 3 [Herbaspirillum sp. RTI4]|uniref:cbb3-type cytochrome oxidase subunit 3 n=1 Tax=Herbaspirillum sp. RTI4 TaxID=3048640 RepID=UPI002AB440EC|nr:cbb3-type cytochrome c oxidase subunit 3 [Herbaspirillum sp. RTI4]MDY7578985.1 cbb3-type cytochrome c oxidase subunit 3 [Herbaspirillum sp. RTI4]MEA9980916.1 cbb3-type cytochrome c oxidase subunit 3 [Herbaspirillum sp. RTI4]
MALDNIMTHASSTMTVISLVTFVGILWWAFSKRRDNDFNEAAHLPFDDDDGDGPELKKEQHHV